MGSENNQNQSVNKGNPNYEELLSYPEFSPLTDESSSSKKRIAAYISEESQKAEASASAPKKKDNKIESFFRKILLPTTVAVATVVTAETIGIVGLSGVSVVGEPLVESYETSVWYSMELEGYEAGGDELAVEVYNDFEHRRELVQTEQDQAPREDGQNPGKGGWFAGEVRDLKPDTDYTFEVLYGSWTVYKQKIRTAKQEEPWQDDPHDDPDTGDPVKPAFSTTETEISYSIPLPEYQEADFFMVALFQGADAVARNRVTDISEDQPNAVGQFSNLEPGTEYTIRLTKNQETIFEQQITTQGAKVQPREPEFSVAETEISYSVPISDYTVGDWYAVYLLENGDMINGENFYDIMPEQEYIGGVFADLQPGTEYTVQLMKNQETIAEWVVSTLEAQQVPEPEFTPTENSIEYRILLPDYSENDWYMVLLVEPTGGVRENEVVDVSPEEPYASGVFADLQPGTEYTVQLMKNQETIAEWVVSTLKPEEESLEPWFEAGETSIYYGIPITWEQTADDWYTAMLMDVTGLTREGQAEIDEDGLYVTGVFPDLQPGTTYTFQLMKNREVVYTETISTQEDSTADPVFPSG